MMEDELKLRKKEEFILKSQLMRKRIGLEIKEIRSKKNMRQAELAFKMGIDEKNLSDLELGKIDFKFSTILLVAEVLEVPVSRFFEIFVYESSV